jgi:hypothetical protein
MFVFCYAKKAGVAKKDSGEVAPGDQSESRKLDEA